MNETTVYLLRHSEPFRSPLGSYNANESEQLRNEKNPLSGKGEMLAKMLSEREELRNIEVLYSSHYVRAMSTAKYIAEVNNIVLNVDERLGERKFGVNNMQELPRDFYSKQYKDWNYKLDSGESLNEVSNRMNQVLLDILKNNEDKTIAIVSHGTAINAMLSKWCKLILNDSNNVEIYFNNSLVFDGNWICPELFKLEFDNNYNLLSITNIR